MLTMEEDPGPSNLERGISRVVSTKPSINRVVSAKTLVKSSHSSDGDYTPAKLAALLKLFLACSVCGGIHYGWGLQISVLTPYAQVLGIPHMYASLICSSGPLAGILVNPMLSFYSDRCTMRIGRRRPFILAGCLIICISVLLIGFATDIGHSLGDPKEQCGSYIGPHKGASAMLIVGFWLLDIANNTIQGPTRALMDDLSVGNNHGPHVGHAMYFMWAVIGAILGYTAGAIEKWPQWFPWLKTEACCGACVNIKGAFFISVVLIVISMTLTMSFSDEKPIDEKDVDTSTSPAFSNPFKCMKNMSSSMTELFIVTGVSWLALYPFFVYSTDWMGREIYHGDPRGTVAEVQMYNNGVRNGAIGLIFCSLSLMVTTFFIPKLCRKLTSKVVWSLSNFMLFLLLLATIIISQISTKGYRPSLSHKLAEPDPTLRALALSIFALIGITASATLCLPWLFAFEIIAEEGDSGQGCTVSAITIAIVLPQLIMVLTTGPIDKAFSNGGNVPAFFLGAALALVCWVLGLSLLSKKGTLSSPMLLF